MLKDIKVGDIAVFEDGTEKDIIEVRTDKPFGPNPNADVWVSAGTPKEWQFQGHYLWDGTCIHRNHIYQNIIEIKVR